MTKVTVEYEPPVPVEPKIKTITLKLSEGDALAIFLAVGKVGHFGPAKSLRKNISNVYDALYEILDKKYPIEKRQSMIEGSLTLSDADYDIRSLCE